METHDLDHGLLLTNDQETTETTQNGTINIQPAWKWLLEDQQTRTQNMPT